MSPKPLEREIFMAAFTNQATLSYNNGSVNSNVVTGELIGVLSVTKNAFENTYSMGSTVTYVVNLTNTGSTPFTDVTVTDNLGAYTSSAGQTVTPLEYVENSAKYLINGELQADPTAQVTGGNLVISGITVPANGDSQILYKVTINSFAPLDVNSTIANVVTVDSGSAQRMPLTASETITVSDLPVLSIVKSMSPSVVSENGTLTYTFTVQNTGNTPAGSADNIVITDIFDPVLTITSVTLNGAPTTDYTYEAASGTFATTAGAITVPAATFTQNADGSYTVTPGTAVLTVTGTV